MKSFCAVSPAVLLLSALSFGQSPAAASAPTGHGAFPVKVVKTLDSSKLKVDDSIEVETGGSFKLPDGTLVPKGSKLTGRVVNAKARSKGDADSVLNLAFDKLSVQGGKQLAVKGTVQAIFPPADEPEGPNMSTMGTSRGGSVGGAGPGGAAGTSPGGGVGITDTKNGSDMQSSSTAQSAADPKSVGVKGMHDLDLKDGVLTSKGKNVKLGGGVRMIVRVEILS